MRKVFMLILFITSSIFALSTLSLENACDNGVATACHELGILNEQGIGVDKNTTRALELYKRACELGFEQSCEKVTSLDTNSTNKE